MKKSSETPEDSITSRPQTRSSSRQRNEPKKGLKVREIDDRADAERLLNDAKYRSGVLKRLDEWLSVEAKIEEVSALVQHFPLPVLRDAKAEANPKRRAKDRMKEMLDEAEQRLLDLEEQLLMSAHFGDDREHAITQRVQILDMRTVKQLESMGEEFGVKVGVKKVLVKQLAERLTDLKPKRPLNLPMLPTLAYLTELYEDDEKLKADAAKLIEDASVAYRAVLFARLFDWKVADLCKPDVRRPKPTPTKQAHSFWSKVPGFESQSNREKMRSIGRLLHKRPVLFFQSILTNMTDEHGWHNSEDTWTPALFESIIRDDNQIANRLDNLRNRFAHVIFPRGIDPPTLRTIPLKFRVIRSGGPQLCKVMPSKGEDGLFAIANLPIGMTWLMGGEPGGRDFDISWDEFNVNIALPEGVRENFHGEVMPDEDDGIVAWKVNEPSGNGAPNAVFLTSPEGVYLTICREINASPEKPVEVLVDYGDNFPRIGYVRTRYQGKNGRKNAKDDWEQTLKAKEVLSSVPGLVESKYYRDDEVRRAKVKK